MDELEDVRGQLTEWERDVVQVILEIPCGRLATYGCLVRMVARRHHGYSPVASRAVGNLRNKLYGLLGHGTQVPLHRIATQGDLYSKNDSETTRTYNDQLREQEETLRQHDPWWCGD